MKIDLAALLLFAPALLAQSTDMMPLARHATELQQSGDYAGAAEAYRKLTALRPDDVVAHVNLGVSLYILAASMKP